MNGALTFDDLFASTGLFGVELAADVAERAGERVAVRGYLYGPLAAGERTFAFGRGAWRSCSCCQGEPAWQDDVAVVEFRAAVPVQLGRHGDPDEEVCVAGRLEVGYAPSGHPGLTAIVRLTDAEVTAAAG